jgi:hypothetical protein
MMLRRAWIRSGVGLATALIFSHLTHAQDDPGKSNMGRVRVMVYYATNGDPKVAGVKTAAIGKKTEKRFRDEERLSFKSYRMLGQDAQPLLRSYESWAQPLKPSEEVLVRFEARSRPTREATGLDLELWLSRKKVLKTYAKLEGNRPLFVLGPEWRGGRLIIAIALASQEKPTP